MIHGLNFKGSTLFQLLCSLMVSRSTILYYKMYPFSVLDFKTDLYNAGEKNKNKNKNKFKAFLSS